MNVSKENGEYVVTLHVITDNSGVNVMYNNGSISIISRDEANLIFDDVFRAIYSQVSGFEYSFVNGEPIIYSGQKASYAIGG